MYFGLVICRSTTSIISKRYNPPFSYTGSKNYIQWVVLYTHEEKGGGSSVLWRALYDAPLLSEIEVGSKLTESGYAEYNAVRKH